jgi:hypothetical protein
MPLKNQRLTPENSDIRALIGDLLPENPGFRFGA